MHEGSVQPAPPSITQRVATLRREASREADRRLASKLGGPWIELLTVAAPRRTSSSRRTGPAGGAGLSRQLERELVLTTGEASLPLDAA